MTNLLSFSSTRVYYLNSQDKQMAAPGCAAFCSTFALEADLE